MDHDITPGAASSLEPSARTPATFPLPLPVARTPAAFAPHEVGPTALRRLVGTGEIERVRRGVYARPAELSSRERHLRLVRSTLPLLHDASVVSHRSAAVVHGLPLPHSDLHRVEVTLPTTSHGRRGAIVHRRHAGLAPDDCTVVDGVPVTSLARTAIDLARVLSYEWGVIVCDAALRAGATHEALADVVENGRGRQGNNLARRAVAFADRRAESPAESLSRVQFARQGVPAPELQFEVMRDGVLVARTDFAWRDRRVVGEVDGAVKYGELLAPGQTAADAVMAEKRREERIRQSGYWIVRWGWREASSPRVLEQLIRRAFELAPAA